MDTNGIHPADVESVLVRRICVTRARTQNGFLLLNAKSFEKPLSIAGDTLMRFGTESITALNYFKRVIERYDLVDAVVLPTTGDVIPIKVFWTHIEYLDNRSNIGTFSQKDDGLFAMRTKSGEKAERVVTHLLSDTYGHQFDSSLYKSPGFFAIQYSGKKHRKPD